ncbi:NADH:ubiquinone reductase (Na(+)-transporting) subunit C [Flavobacterium tibetense]|jgi:Na+-transporting NADH:ubiquinone oxidoreductase subunit C|uniref:Na(+)-translocating NADH-quinone reductase subunit C n=1 Tax=Flavobacterium tibetense TaxID=2233533 RepID=A0A365P4M1_9FLAO|nr:NADH:ubiquinone reductase (Na(+)-transporting) subunit C [Flavobacterium tibetense]RBA29545.1 NADH:ubiquinone reductase (Na(+)-transporting) subunit C [Flavobacterium tibetense]
MSTKRTDSNSYTIIFSVIMVVVVGSLLAFFANFTKDLRVKNDQVKAQIDILSAIGVESDRSNATEMFTQYIKQQKVIAGTEVSDDEKAYLIDVKKEMDGAKKGNVQRLPLFVAEKDGKTLYILPVRGNGLWDAIWGYIAINDDLKTINGVYFDHKAETPGLGANITESFFTDDFKGEYLYDASGNFKGIEISKSNGDPNNEDKTDNQVDAISGATITGNGVGAMINSGIRAYLPYFETLKK